MSLITYHVLSNPEIKAKLQNELREARKNGRPTLSQLEQLPYLSAVVSEGLRLSFGLSTRLQRVSPDQALVYKQWTIPPGVSSSHLTSCLPNLVISTELTSPDSSRHDFRPHPSQPYYISKPAHFQSRSLARESSPLALPRELFSRLKGMPGNKPRVC